MKKIMILESVFVSQSTFLQTETSDKPSFNEGVVYIF